MSHGPAEHWGRRLGRRLAFAAGLLLLTGLVLYQNGGAITVAALNNSWGQPYFDPGADAATPPCDGATPCTSGPLRVLSYNVYNGSTTVERLAAPPSCAPWSERVPHVRAVLAEHAADLVGLQEFVETRDVQSVLPDSPPYHIVTYTFGGRGYGDAAILYRNDRFELLDSGQFWLSPTPELPFGFGWQRLSVWRYVNWAYLREENTGFRFLFVNTHFDNNGPNKESSAPLVAEVFGEYAQQVPIVFSGDFNTNRTTTRYTNLITGDAGEWLHNTYDLAADPRFDTRPLPLEEHGRWIDHIFVGGPVTAEVTRWFSAETYYERNKPLSDHPLVVVDFTLTRKVLALK